MLNIWSRLGWFNTSLRLVSEYLNITRRNTVTDKCCITPFQSSGLFPLWESQPGAVSFWIYIHRRLSNGSPLYLIQPSPASDLIRYSQNRSKLLPTAYLHTFQGNTFYTITICIIQEKYNDFICMILKTLFIELFCPTWIREWGH